ncbi:AP-5 complex subunit beta-1 isoform X1 [Scyliorhinus canicula]|uniref:AP-5 complex subunit beta-1 isoform X1 n=1 Tax=Scyliorhinus canicula TaxID=7830 RepID=UPI0018F37501|nr:AP-5 complex subunit beta-1 isoform X1 [Scyliorhinus canicula]XP_038677511.1 AP-5 complex subunit beta-1 isoform X1 [Scyliorhinus canicula]XP_038677512.1 AP-5 complex subunit beta-1 isoform X1 [Scyliorhinus canicula]XP_038677513.1 AP-5 complex subunit beta-1 isoform X1 [Scyliorhinus canicula]
MALPNYDWAQKLAAFHADPARFLDSTTTQNFVGDLLRALTDEKTGENVKKQILGVIQEFPTWLFTNSQAAERAAESIFSIYSQLPFVPKAVNLKCHLLLSVTTIVITTDHLISNEKVLKNLMRQLLDAVCDTNDRKYGGGFRPLRAVACDCLREFETCYPGLLSRKLDLLHTLQQKEVTPLHQAYTLLYSQVLKNAIRALSQSRSVSDGAIREMLTRNEEIKWKVMAKAQDLSAVTITSGLSSLPSTVETKELKSSVTLLLEECFLLTPVSQAALLREVIQVVLLVRSLAPAIFRSQLLRLFGTMDISLLHTMLHMKATFTDSLFTVEDENFLLKRLVCMAHHPLLSNPLKLFYMDCLLHFPENRPINSNLEENLPILFTPKMAACLFPTLFNDSSTMLSCLNLVSLMSVENAEEDRGLAEIFDYLMSLYKLVDVNGSRERTVTFFRAVYIFVGYFHTNEMFMVELTQYMVKLYQRHCTLAPHMINLINSTQNLLEDAKWPVSLAEALQKMIVEFPSKQLSPHKLMWHLRVLTRVAKEATILQKVTVQFLLNVVRASDVCRSGDWRTGNAVLAVCRSILHHQNLEPIFSDLADLLQHIHLQFQDVDIQDHAHFYYALLTCLSHEKLARIVAEGTGNCSRAKTRSLSSLMSESTGHSISVLPIKHPVLKLIPVPEEHCPNLSAAGDTSEMDYEEDYLEKYLGQFCIVGFASTIVMKFHLTFAERVDPEHHRVYAIHLHFDLRNSHYEPLSDLYVPCLFFNGEPHVFSLPFKPRLPFPITLYTSAIFTREDGSTCCSQLEPLDVGFSRLFLTLPVPKNWPSKIKASLFDQLWTSLAQADSSQSALSRFCFQTAQRPLSELVTLHFQKYVVSQKSDPESYKIFLFLPPQTNILFSVEQLDSVAKVDIVTDNWKLLPFINSYLIDITSQK